LLLSRPPVATMVSIAGRVGVQTCDAATDPMITTA